MSEQDIRPDLIEIFRKYAECDADALLSDQKLEELVDSMSFLEIIFDIEEKFGISVSDDDVKELKTFSDVVNGVQGLLADKAS